jgi:hypothetical protein
MNSMENFFNWMSKPIPNDEVTIWFNIHNMNIEKIELYGDIFKSLNHIIVDTYMGDSGEHTETKISLSKEDKESHFDWCWSKVVGDFKKENINIKEQGEHKDYFKSFFMDTFYTHTDKSVKESIPTFIFEVFDINKPFSKSDLDILTELYKMLEKRVS